MGPEPPRRKIQFSTSGATGAALRREQADLAAAVEEEVRRAREAARVNAAVNPLTAAAETPPPIEWERAAPRWLLVLAVALMASALLAVAVWYVSGLEANKAETVAGAARLGKVEGDLATVKDQVEDVKQEQVDQRGELARIRYEMNDAWRWQAEQAGDRSRVRSLTERLRGIASTLPPEPTPPPPARPARRPTS